MTKEIRAFFSSFLKVKTIPTIALITSPIA